MSDRRDDNRTIKAAQFELAVEPERDGGAAGRPPLLLLGALSAVLGLAVIVVVFVLPRWVGAPEPEPEPGPAPTASAEAAAPVADAEQTNETTPAEPAPVETSAAEASTAIGAPAQSASRGDTQALLRETLEQLEALEALDAEHWARSELHALKARIADGERAYREKRYNAAKNIYLDTRAAVTRLLEQVPDILTALLEAGELALANGSSADAAEAFEQALKMDADNERAARGRARAATLDQVLALVSQAEGYERLGETDKATAAYREALALDAQAPGAAAARARIERGEREAAFRRAMSAGYAALAKERYGDARSAFNKAKQLGAGRAEVDEALSQVDNAETAARIDAALARAAEAVAAERWDDAHTAFEQALKHDPRLSPAVAGRTRAAARRRLDAQLVAYLARPERLGDDAVHAEASAVLAKARETDAPGPRLSGQISRLARALELARSPIALTLRSDGMTAVEIYRVGPQGSFQERRLELLPGDYVAVGRRDGYRDVRVEFKLRHGEPNPPLVVQCVEKFAF